MYNSISYQFKEQSKYLKNQTLYMGLPFVYLIISGLLVYILKWDIFNPFYRFFIFFGSIFLLILITYYSLIIYTVKNEDEFSWKKIWRIIKITNLYTNTVHRKDMELLIEILKNHNVNTRPKVLEVLKHYQCLLPRKILSHGQFLSILALTIASLTFFFQESIYNSEGKLLMVLFIILMVILIYTILYTLNNNFLRTLGEDALNERIEMAISEIWMNSLIK